MFEFLKIKKKSKSEKKQLNHDSLENKTTSQNTGSISPIKHESKSPEISIELMKKAVCSFSQKPIESSLVFQTSLNSASVPNSNAATPRIARRDLMDLEISQLKLGRFVSEFSYEPRKPPYISKGSARKNNMFSKFGSETKVVRASSTPANRSTSSNRARDDPVYLSKFAGGYEPDPNKPKRIESLEWLFYDRMSNYETDSCKKNFDSSSPFIKSRTRSIDLYKFPKYQSYIFDSECYDYLSKFKPSVTKDSISLNIKYDNGIYNEKVKHTQEKLHNEIEKISKYENRSSMIADLLPDLKTYEKNLRERIDIDPWKASRSRNASVEPSSRTRYQSPINASPSRICRENCVSSFSSPYFKRLLGVSSYGNSINNERNELITSRSSLTESGSENVFHDEFDIEIKKKINKKNQSNSSLAGSYRSGIKIANERYFTCKEIDVELKSGYGLKKRCKSNMPKMTPTHAQKIYSNFKPKNLIKSIEKNSNCSAENRFTGSYSNFRNLSDSKRNQIFAYEILKVKPKKIYPHCIDRTSLEKHLSVKEFECIFGMNKQQFYELSTWKQIEFKKNANLF